MARGPPVLHACPWITEVRLVFGLGKTTPGIHGAASSGAGPRPLEPHRWARNAPGARRGRPNGGSETIVRAILDATLCPNPAKWLRFLRSKAQLARPRAAGLLMQSPRC